MSQRGTHVRMGRLVVTVVLALEIVACSGSAATPAARLSPSPVQDCRGSTETAPGGPSPLSGVTYVNLTVDNRLRDYRLFQPPNLDLTKPTPLVIMLHGSPADAAAMESIIHLDDEATTAGFLEASPNGCGGFWSYAEGGPKAVDENFIGRVIDQLESKFRIDKARVFIVAVSAGTWVAYRLACDLSNQIAAIASVSGTMRLADDCRPGRPVSVLEMHGTLDNQHPWQGGGPHGASPVDAVIQRWTQLDGCAGNPSLTQVGITVTSVWKECQGGAVVRLDKVVGGNHTWFGSSFDPVPGEPNANAVIWTFFSSLQLRA
jgi:polyhydroxybutyrate depolymerase